MDGNVWEWQVPSAEVIGVRQRFRVSAMVRRREGMQMRIVSASAPGPGATLVAATLEDAYLHAIGRADGAGASAAAGAGPAPMINAVAPA